MSVSRVFIVWVTVTVCTVIIPLFLRSLRLLAMISYVHENADVKAHQCISQHPSPHEPPIVQHMRTSADQGIVRKYCQRIEVVSRSRIRIITPSLRDQDAANAPVRCKIPLQELWDKVSIKNERGISKGRTRATPPATIMPRAETPLMDAAPVKGGIGLLVG
jgi:hypothetical protein